MNTEPILDESDLDKPESYWDDPHWPFPRLVTTYKALANLTDEQAMLVIKINSLVCHNCWSQRRGCFCRRDD